MSANRERALEAYWQAFHAARKQGRSLHDASADAVEATFCAGRADVRRIVQDYGARKSHGSRPVDIDHAAACLNLLQDIDKDGAK